VYEGNGIYTIAGNHNPVGNLGSVIWLMKVKVNIIPPQEEENPPEIGGFNSYLLWLFLSLAIIGVVIAQKSKKEQNPS
jgi:hypothetical protein